MTGRWYFSFTISLAIASAFVACGLGHNPDLPFSRSGDAANDQEGEDVEMSTGSTGLGVPGQSDNDGSVECGTTADAREGYGLGGQGGEGGQSAQSAQNTALTSPCPTPAR